MKILYHHRTLGDGAEGIHVAEIVNAFRSLGHDVRVVSLIGEKTNVRSASQSRWSFIKKLMPGFIFEFGEMAYNIQGFLTLSRAVNQFKPDFIYDRYVSYNYSAVAVGRLYKLPTILEVNSPYSYQKQTFDEKLYFNRLSRFFERKICEDATWVIVVSSPLKSFLTSIGVTEDKIVVMPNGANTALFNPSINGLDIRRQYGLNGKVVIGFTGILRPWHGLDLLIEAFGNLLKEFPNPHLLIVGDGPIRSELERMVTQKGLSKHVTITGRQPHEKIRRFVAAMDIAVSPNTTFYASPMKILEYMAMEKVVVAPDMENIRDILSHEETGLLFRPGDASDLERVLKTIIHDTINRRSLGKKARNDIEAKRTWIHNAKDIEKLIEASKNLIHD
ncbi:MAG: glycosyltransferase family 4 protein [Nitrospiria bacterium]